MPSSVLGLVGRRVRILPFSQYPNRYNGWAGNTGTVVEESFRDEGDVSVLVATDDGFRVWRILPDVEFL